MSDQGKVKPKLPFGWIVRQSSSFPDRIYYFNVQTGASTWEIPDLQQQLNPYLTPEQKPHSTSRRPSDVKFGIRKSGVNCQTAGVNQQVPGVSGPVPGVNRSVPGVNYPIPSVNHQIPGGSQHFPIEAKFSPEFSDDDSFDLTLDTSNDNNPASVSCNYDREKEHRTKDTYSFGKQTKQGINVQFKPIRDSKPSHTQGALSSAVSERSTSSSVENANRIVKGQKTLSQEPGISPSKKVRLLSDSDTKDSGSRYVLSAKDNFNTKCSYLKTSKPVPNPPDILVGTEKCVVPSDLPDCSSNKVIPSVKRKVKDRLGTPLCSASLRAEDSRKFDKRKVCYSPKGSVIETDTKTVKTEPGNTVNRVKKKATSKHNEVTKTLGGDLRKVISSSETSQCSIPLVDFKDAESAARDRIPSGSVYGSEVHVPNKRHLTDPEKRRSIQSWIDHCEPEDDLSDKSSEILVPSWDISSPDHDSGRGSLAPRNYMDSRRVVVSNDKLSVSTGDSVLQPTGGESRKDAGAFPKNNSWKGVHATPAPVAHRSVMNMEIDELGTEPVALEDRQIEDMDVAEIALKEVREQLQKQIPTEVTGSLTKRVSGSDSQSKLNSLHHVQKLLIVVDTNVLIESLGFVEDLRDQEFKKLAKPVLVIPWVVMQELDALKNSKNNFSLATARRARGPVNFLFQCFKVQHPRVIGQTPKEAKQALEEFTPECNDDRILHCCLDLKKRNPESHVILLSNDKNLCSKATILNLKAYSRHTVMAGIETQSVLLSSEQVSTSPEVHRTPTKNPRLSPIRSPTGTSVSSKLLQKSEESYNNVADQILCKAKLLMKSSLSIVLEKEMKVAYDDIWMDIVFKKPPWTLEDILDCFKKHWIAVFGMIYNRKLKEEVHRLVEKFKPFKGFIPSVESVGELVDDAVRIAEECESHSNYGTLFSQASTELKLVQKFQQECHAGTISETSLDTYLKKNTSTGTMKRLSMDSDTKRPPSGTDSVTPPSVASSQMSPCVSDASVVHLQPVENRFRTIWQTILSLCDTMNTWVETSPKDHLQEMNDILIKLVPFVKDLRFHFEHTLSLSPTQIKSQQAYVHNLSIKLNTFFSTMEIEIEEWKGCRKKLSRTVLVRSSSCSEVFRKSQKVEQTSKSVVLEKI
ncbi:Transcriptional protein SWT1 [Mizuhopecten yessoensis]|uniref:Transcriptional protein SWT1 n=1 Tax=Mizuhopecten yessoensis TaxID=6573 RepID=A0A210QVB1_MIZYE|nr:Transcriptional protein SWT1 [Mizuhopecten yessoensis]